jgi:hypothetical protein
MSEQKIVEYIKSQLGVGIDRNKIRNDLLLNGSLPSEIDLAFNSLNNNNMQNSNIPMPPPAPQIPVPTPNPTVPQYSPVNPVSVFTEQTPKKSILGKILLTVGILVLVGAVSAGAYFGYDYYKGSQISLGKAVVNTIEAISAGEITSGEFSVNMEITAKDVGENYSDLAPDTKQIVGQFEDVAFKLAYSGVFSINNDDKFETAGNLNASVKNPTGGQLGMLGSQELDLEYKIFSDNIYLNIQKIPSITAMIFPLNIDTTKYLNQWFSMPSTLATQTSESFTRGFTANGTRNLSTTTISEETKLQIINFFDDEGIFTVIDKKTEKTAKGTAVTALYLNIDWDKLGDKIIEVNKENSGKNGIATYSKAQELEVRTSIEKMKELPVNSSVLKVLVGGDGYLYGYIATGDLMDNENKNIGSYKISSVVDNFNKKFIIDRPTNARDFNEALLEISDSLNIKAPSKPVVKTGGSTSLFPPGFKYDSLHKGKDSNDAIVITGIKTQSLLMTILEAYAGSAYKECIGKCTIKILSASATTDGKQIIKVSISNGTMMYFDVTDYAL